MESAMETNKDAKVVSKKKQNIMYSEVKAISHIGKKKYGTDDFETIALDRQIYHRQLHSAAICHWQIAVTSKRTTWNFNAWQIVTGKPKPAIFHRQK